jgi:L-rhamnonate dehydratase
MWDQMFRATLPYGRKGVAIHAISAVDLVRKCSAPSARFAGSYELWIQAIWDILGKLRNEPVYNLIGGKTKPRVRPLFNFLERIGLTLCFQLPIYATTDRPDLAKDLGFKGAKFPLPYGPGDGEEGFRKNLERVKQVRDSVGPDFLLMIDCYMGS